MLRQELYRKYGGKQHDMLFRLLWSMWKSKKKNVVLSSGNLHEKFISWPLLILLSCRENLSCVSPEGDCLEDRSFESSAATVTKEMPRGSPPSSSSRTNRLPESLTNDRGTWYLNSGYITWPNEYKYIFPEFQYVICTYAECKSSCIQYLWWTSWGGKKRNPVAAYTLSINPGFSFPHRAQVQGKRLSALWHVEDTLPVQFMYA